MNKPTNLLFLNTRPAAQAGALSTLIEAAGAKAIHFPCIEIIPTDPHTLKTQIAALGPIDYAVFLSANAVHAALPVWPMIHPTIIAIGPGTDQALAQFERSANYIPQHFSSEGLLELPLLKKLGGKKIVVFCGENSRPLLARSLRERGALVRECICYQRRCPSQNTEQLSFIQSQKISAIISTSLESLNNVYYLLGSEGRDWLLNTTMLVISPAMAERCRELGFTHPALVAKNASNAAIMECLSSFLTH